MSRVPPERFSVVFSVPAPFVKPRVVLIVATPPVMLNTPVDVPPAVVVLAKAKVAVEGTVNVPPERLIVPEPVPVAMRLAPSVTLPEALTEKSPAEMFRMPVPEPVPPVPLLEPIFRAEAAIVPPSK